MDVVSALLQSDLFEEVYMDIPPSFASLNQGRIVCKLNKSLYRLKQASRQWNIKLSDALVSNGYVQSKHNYSLFTKQ